MSNILMNQMKPTQNQKNINIFFSQITDPDYSKMLKLVMKPNITYSHKQGKRQNQQIRETLGSVFGEIKQTKLKRLILKTTAQQNDSIQFLVMFGKVECERPRSSERLH